MLDTDCFKFMRIIINFKEQALKKLSFMIAIMVLLLLTSIIGSANAAEQSGNAIMPGIVSVWGSSTTAVFTTAYITNISATDVTCIVTWYDHDGNDVTNYCKVYSGNNSSTSNQLIASGTGTFTLPAGSTRFVHFYSQNQLKALYGHAVIKWTSTNSKLRQALIATGRVIGTSSSNDTQNAYSIPINNNKAF